MAVIRMYLGVFASFLQPQHRLYMLFLAVVLAQALGPVVSIDAGAGQKTISSALYGRNNTLSHSPSQPLSATTWQYYREAGVRLFRDNGGNNATKYNWRRKLSSHPDWYNNVYPNDWDYAVQSLEANMPGAQGFWAFQLLGKVAATSAHNFNDWGYNFSQWWPGVTNNWAGGGGPTTGTGNPDLYLMDWPADSTTAILAHWRDNLGVHPETFRYWNMDNEPEIWNGTHDDVMPTLLAADAFIEKYVAVAKLARQYDPDIRLVGPVAANEWQWYNWNNDKITTGGKSYTWLEYFIKRIGEEQAASGVRLLDVLDVHFYPGETSAADQVQLHRVWFDRTYLYPGANGVKRSGASSWDNSIQQEFVFARCRDWLDTYLGPDHGVTFGVSETSIPSSDPNVLAVWYASNLGVFMDEGVELFTPWDWKTGMWEVLHLFSRYAGPVRVQGTSDQPTVVSGHATLSASADTLTVYLINRSLTAAQTTTVNIAGFTVADGVYPTWMIDDLPASETFVSHTQNALLAGMVSVQQGQFIYTLPALSVTAVQLTGQGAVTIATEPWPSRPSPLSVYPSPFRATATVSYHLDTPSAVRIAVFDVRGRQVRGTVLPKQPAGDHVWKLSGEGMPSGVYLLRLEAGGFMWQQTLVRIR